MATYIYLQSYASAGEVSPCYSEGLTYISDLVLASSAAYRDCIVIKAKISHKISKLIIEEGLTYLQLITGTTAPKPTLYFKTHDTALGSMTFSSDTVLRSWNRYMEPCKFITIS